MRAFLFEHNIMRKNLNEIDLDTQYSKAKAAFEECIANEDNKFLNEEIEMSVSKLITKNESVKITFFGSDNNQYLVETLLLLFKPNDEKIGYYCYLENESEEVVDDFLVFE